MIKTLLPIGVAALLSPALPSISAATDLSKTADSAIQPAVVIPNSCGKPEYPPESIKNGDQGDVLAGFMIATDGHILSSQILKSSGHTLLDEAAINAMTQCRFNPGTKNGVPVESTTKMTYSWKIEGPKPVASKRSAGNDKTLPFTLKRDPSTGSNIARANAFSSLPLDKRYDELTLEQTGQIRNYYESMAEDDEPPYPATGLQSLLRPLIQAGGKLAAEGKLSLEIMVDSQGNATAVNILSAPSAEMANFAAQLGMLTKYKPAVCGGQPCAMGFPVRVDMKKIRP